MKKLLTLTAMAAILAPSMAMADYTFALGPKAMNNPFFDLARDGCYKAQEELADVTCEYIGPGEHTELEQIQIVQDLITKGVDGIAVAPSNAPAMAKVLKAAADAGIPVMTWDSDLLDKDKSLRTTYVGTNNYDIGVNLAKLIQARHPDGGTVCLQTGGAAAANHNERLKGARDTLSGKDTGTPPGSALAGDGGWTEISGCPLITNDDGNVAQAHHLPLRAGDQQNIRQFARPGQQAVRLHDNVAGAAVQTGLILNSGEGPHPVQHITNAQTQLAKRPFRHLDGDFRHRFTDDFHRRDGRVGQ